MSTLWLRAMWVDTIGLVRTIDPLLFGVPSVVFQPICGRVRAARGVRQQQHSGGHLTHQGRKVAGLPNPRAMGVGLSEMALS